LLPKPQNPLINILDLFKKINVWDFLKSKGLAKVNGTKRIRKLKCLKPLINWIIQVQSWSISFSYSSPKLVPIKEALKIKLDNHQWT